MAAHAMRIALSRPVSDLIHGEDLSRLSNDKINIPRHLVCHHFVACSSIRAPPSLVVKKGGGGGGGGPLFPTPHSPVTARKFRSRLVALKSENAVPPRPSSLRVATLSLLAAPVLGATYLLIHATTVLVSAYRRGLGSAGGGGNGGGRSGGGFSGGGGTVTAGPPSPSSVPATRRRRRRCSWWCRPSTRRLAL